MRVWLVGEAQWYFELAEHNIYYDFKNSEVIESEHFQVQPKTNQIFAGASCIVCDEMENYAKQNEIQLITHKDSAGELIHLVSATFHLMRAFDKIVSCGKRHRNIA